MTSPKRCIEKDCDQPAGTPWTDLWCPKHDEERKERITKQLEEIIASFGGPS